MHQYPSPFNVLQELDAEAVTFLRDGSFYVSDEYQAAILYFDASGRQIGAIQANPDLLPRVLPV